MYDFKIRCKFQLKCVPYLSFTKINSNDQLDLIGSCVSNCNGTNLEYNFTLFYMPTGALSWTPFSQDSYYVKTNEKFIIKKQLFTDYPYVLWKVQMTGSLINYFNENLESATSTLFYVNYSPKSGTCDINPKSGNTNDLFTLSCLNWLDSDGFVAKYVYYGKFKRKFYYEKKI